MEKGKLFLGSAYRKRKLKENRQKGIADVHVRRAGGK